MGWHRPLLHRGVWLTGVCLSATGTCSCSTKGAGSPGASDFVPADAQYEATVSASNCVPPGTPSNASGVGGYCSPGGRECMAASPDAATPLCTADLNVPSGAWFCTIMCDATAACGPGATCLSSIRGPACVPSACVALLREADGGIGGEASDGGGSDAGRGPTDGALAEGSVKDATDERAADGGAEP